MFCQKHANGIANSEDADQSDLDLHCLPRPICPKTYDHYGIVSLSDQNVVESCLCCFRLTEVSNKILCVIQIGEQIQILKVLISIHVYILLFNFKSLSCVCCEIFVCFG